MKNNIILVTLLVMSIVASAKESFIKGIAPSFKNKTFTVYSVSEFLTNTKEKVAELKTGENGNFKVDFDITDVTYVLIDFGKVERYLFIEPGKTYHVKVDNIATDILASQSVFATDEQPINITNNDSTELNELLLRVESDIALFTLQNKNDLLYKAKKEIIDDFANSLNRKYPVNQSNFFSIYVEYSLAQLYQLCYKSSPDLFAIEFLLGKSTYPNNPAYMRVFKKEFNQYLNSNIDPNFALNIFNLINSNNYASVIEELYPSSKNYGQDFKELLLLHSFYENYGNPRIRKESVENLISQMINRSGSKANKLVATNIQKRIKELNPGSAAPDFALYNIDSAIVQLSNYAGNYVYLGFAESWSRPFEMDIKIMQQWMEKYPELQIITILVDEDRAAYEDFIEKYQPEWTVLHAGLVPTVTLDYKLNNYPSYFLIGPDGKLIMSPAKSPYDRFEKQYINYLNQME